MPYIRSTDGGLSWEEPRNLVEDTSASPCITYWHQIVTNARDVYIFYVYGYCRNGAEALPVYFVKSSDRGTTWSLPIQASSDKAGAIFSASVHGDTMASVYVPDVNDMVLYPRITRSTNGGSEWTKNPFDMPSSASNQLRVVLTPGLLNLFSPPNTWEWLTGPEVALCRSTNVASTWADSTVLSPVDDYGSDMPEVASYDNVLSHNTTLGVMWRGEEFAGAGFSAGMALRLSSDNGETWQPLQVVSDTPRGSFHALAVRGNVVAAAWSYELSDFGPFKVKTRVSFDKGKTWGKVDNLTPEAENAGDPTIALSPYAVHVAWNEYIDGKWNIYYRRGELRQVRPTLSRTSFDFDTLAVGCSRMETVTLHNVQSNPLYVVAMVPNVEDYSVSPSEATIPPQDSAAFTVRFFPLSIGDKSGRLLFMHDQALTPETVTVAAVAIGTGNEVVIADSFGVRWQLISVPVESPCPYVFRGSFRYENGYHAADSLAYGRGYWSKLMMPYITFAGTPVLDDTLPITDGWNLIGSVSTPLAVNSLQSIPGGVTVSEFYSYNGRYFTSDTINPGRGYWVKVSQNAELILSASAKGLSFNQIKIKPINELPPSVPDGDTQQPNFSIPIQYALQQNYPNPFNPTTKIRYQTSEVGHVTLKVYDIFGREVVTLVNERMPAGVHEVKWNAEGFASGIYFYRLQTPKFTETKKLLILR
jgi:hypothetical protein